MDSNLSVPSCSKNSNTKEETDKDEINIKEDSDIKEYLKEEEVLSNTENEVTETHLDVAKLHNEPIYAEICSFLNMFGSLLNIKPIPFLKLDNMFCTLYNGEGRCIKI